MEDAKIPSKANANYSESKKQNADALENFSDDFHELISLLIIKSH